MKNYTITVNGNIYDVVVEEGSVSGVTAAKADTAVHKVIPPVVEQKTSGGEGAIEVKAGTAGKIVKIVVEIGQSVKAGDSVVIVEAMKMEIPVVASVDGTVASIHVSDGESVEAGAVLATLNES